jgi:AcrR family transcriptional regulator
MNRKNLHSTRQAKRRTTGRQDAGATHPLTQELIVNTALELVNKVGLASFSTRALGEQLGCEAMSIYHHFESKQHLLDAMVDHALRSVEVPELKPGVNALAALKTAIYSYRSMARRWPGMFPLIATHRLNTARGVRFIESILVLVSALSPDAETTARRFRAIGYYLTGAGLEETAGYARGPSAAVPVTDEFVQQECPHLMSVASYFKEAHWDSTFDYGINALLKEIAESNVSTGQSSNG